MFLNSFSTLKFDGSNKIKKIFGLTSGAKPTKTNKKKRALKRMKTFVRGSMDVSLTSQRKYNGDPHMCC